MADAQLLCSSCRCKSTSNGQQAKAAGGAGRSPRALSTADQKDGGADRPLSVGSRISTRAAPPAPLVLRLPIGADVQLPSSPQSPLSARQGSTRSLPVSPRTPTTPIGVDAVNSVRPRLVLRKSEPGPSASASLIPKRGILKPTTSSPSSPRSPPGAGALVRPGSSLALQKSNGSPSDGWTPPTLHGISAEPVVGRLSSSRPLRVKRSTPSLPQLSFEALALELRPAAAAAAAVTVAVEPPTPSPPVPAPASYFLFSLHRRMSDADLAALTERTKPQSSPPPPSPSLLSGRLDLSSLRRRGGIGETPRIERNPPPVVGRTAAVQSHLARSDSIGSSGSSAGQSVRSVALREKRKARVRARTVGAYDINEEQTLCEVVGSPPRTLPVTSPSRHARLARPETQLYLLPSSSSASSSAPGSRPATPNTVWRHSLFAEAVGQSLRGSSAGSSTSNLPLPPTPPKLPAVPSKSPLKMCRPFQSRQATLSGASTRSPVGGESDRAVLAPTPDLFGEHPTVRRQASRPLLSDSLRDSIASSLLGDDGGHVARRSLASQHPWTGIAPGAEFDPDDFEDAALYASVGSRSSGEPSTLSSSSSGRTLEDDLPTMAADATGLSVCGDELSERGTLGERRTKGGPPTLVVEVASPPAVAACKDSAHTPWLRNARVRSPLTSRFRRSISGLPSNASDRSTTGRAPVEVAWASRTPSTATNGSFYGIATSTFTSSTPDLPSHVTVSADVPPVPSPSSSNPGYQPATPLLQDLDPRLPITNTVPRLPPSPSAVFKGMFSRRRSKYHASSGLSSADPAPSLGTVLKRSRLATIPVAAFSSSSDEPGPPMPPPTPRTSAEIEDRTVAAWAATTAARDPSISRLEGLLYQHQELERERLRLIIDGPARPPRSTRRIVV